MRKALIAMTGMVVVGVALTACAGPATGNRVALTLDHGPRAQTTPWLNKQRLLRAEPGPATGSRVVLPLDHGPRAQTTPWLNKQRLLRAEQEAAAKAQEQGTSKPDAAK